MPSFLKCSRPFILTPHFTSCFFLFWLCLLSSLFWLFLLSLAFKVLFQAIFFPSGLHCLPRWFNLSFILDSQYLHSIFSETFYKCLKFTVFTKTHYSWAIPPQYSTWIFPSICVSITSKCYIWLSLPKTCKSSLQHPLFHLLFPNIKAFDFCILNSYRVFTFLTSPFPSLQCIFWLRLFW